GDAMKRTLFLALALSAATALAACDRSDDTAVTTTSPNADGSVTMPSPAPENTAPATGGLTPPADSTTPDGTMGGTTGSTTAPCLKAGQAARFATQFATEEPSLLRWLFCVEGTQRRTDILRRSARSRDERI